jgi:AraC family transcriptional regulator
MHSSDLALGVTPTQNPPPPSLSGNLVRSYDKPNFTRARIGVTESGAYGARIAALLHLADAPSITVKARRGGQLAVTRLRCDTGLMEPSEPIAAESAFLVNLHLREVDSYQWWFEGRPSVAGSYSRGAIDIVNLAAGPAALRSSPFDSLQFYVSRAALDEIADDNGARRIEDLVCPRGNVDPVVHQLGSTILAAMENPERACRLFLNHAVLALLAHFARIYGDMRIDCQPVRGGLAPWQMRRSTEMLLARLDGEACLSKVARECQLSLSHFVRAFKQTIGLPPYRWLVEQRVRVAKDLLLQSTLPMVEIATKCGFADQASFIRAFKRTAEMTPGEWRRTRRC